MICLLLVTLLGIQHPHKTMNDRGAVVMGFDQEKTVHHFYLFENGGAIEVGVRDLSNEKDRDAIGSHLPHITTMFQAGEFEVPMLVHDSKNVPGVGVLMKRKGSISYAYEKTARGGQHHLNASGANGSRPQDGTNVGYRDRRSCAYVHRQPNARSLRSCCDPAGTRRRRRNDSGRDGGRTTDAPARRLRQQSPRCLR